MIRLLPILAQTQYRNRLKGLRSAFNKEETEATDVQSIVIFFAVLAAIIIVIAIAHHLRQKRSSGAAQRHPRRLFNQVMKRLGLGLADRLMMRSLAGRCELEQPTVLFFNRDYFDRQAGQWVESISVRPIQDYSRSRVAAIKEMVFDTNAPPDAHA